MCLLRINIVLALENKMCLLCCGIGTPEMVLQLLQTLHSMHT